MSHLLSWIDSSRSYFQQLGWPGVFLYALVIAGVQLFLAPISPLSLGAAVIFGFGRGLFTSMLGATLGLSLNFLIARYVAREAVARRLAQHEKFRLIDAALGREGWKIVFLLRFVPMPFGLANYAYGITAIRFWPYVLASAAAILPSTIFFVWVGATTGEGMQALTGHGRPRHPMEYVLMGAGLLGFLGALTFIGRIARAALARGEAPKANAGAVMTEL